MCHTDTLWDKRTYSPSSWECSQQRGLHCQLSGGTASAEKSCLAQDNAPLESSHARWVNVVYRFHTRLPSQLGTTLKGQPSFRAPCEAGWVLSPECIAVQLSSLPSHTFFPSLPFQKYRRQGFSLNFLHTNLHLRFFFRGTQPTIPWNPGILTTEQSFIIVPGKPVHLTMYYISVHWAHTWVFSKILSGKGRIPK